MSADWNKQLLYSDVAVGDELPELVLPLTVQRLVMEAGVNRDFQPMHHDNEYGQKNGAPAMFANTWYYVGLTERHLREWVGLRGEILKIGPFRMGKFACPGMSSHCYGRVAGKREEDGKYIVDLDIWQNDGSEDAVNNLTGKAVVALPME